MGGAPLAVTRRSTGVQCWVLGMPAGRASLLGRSGGVSGGGAFGTCRRAASPMLCAPLSAAAGSDGPVPVSAVGPVRGLSMGDREALLPLEYPEHPAKLKGPHKPVVVNGVLRRFLGRGVSTRPAITRYISRYVRARGLQVQDDRTKFRPDANLRAILGVEECTFLQVRHVTDECGVQKWRVVSCSWSSCMAVFLISRSAWVFWCSPRLATVTDVACMLPLTCCASAHLHSCAHGSLFPGGRSASISLRT